MSELEYLAGFFDGEGCVTTNGHLNLCVDVEQVQPAVLELFRVRFGGTIRLNTRRRLNQRPIWAWKVYGQEARRCLQDLLPYLLVKAEEARVGIELQTWTSSDPYSVLRAEAWSLRRALVEHLSALKRGMVV